MNQMLKYSDKLKYYNHPGKKMGKRVNRLENPAGSGPAHFVDKYRKYYWYGKAEENFAETDNDCITKGCPELGFLH